MRCGWPRHTAVGVARATAELHVGVSEIDLEIGDIESAKRELQTAAALGEPASMSEGRYRWFLAMGRVADAEGDPLEAITLLDQAQQLYLPGLFPGVRPIPAVKARVRISQGDAVARPRTGPRNEACPRRTMPAI